MYSKIIIVCTVSAFLAIAGITHADVSHLPINAAPVNSPPVTEVCLGCICEAISGCNRTLTCNGDVCGLFRITWAYWSDAGKPTLDSDAPDAPDAYSNCVIDPYCAARAVQGYMAKFGQDCNGDGIINCYDHAAIHKLGGYGCNSGNLNVAYSNTLDRCLNAFSG